MKRFNHIVIIVCAAVILVGFAWYDQENKNHAKIQTRQGDVETQDPPKWSATELKVYLLGKVEGNLQQKAEVGPDNLIVVINGLFSNPAEDHPVLSEQDIILLTEHWEEGVLIYEGKWYSFGFGVAASSEKISSFIFHKSLVSGGCTLNLQNVQILRLDKKSAEDPLTITLLENPCRINIAFMIERKTFGKLKLQFGDNVFELPQPIFR
jgi:hypothetical protein